MIQPGVPESFHVLLKELQSLGLSVELLNEEEDRLNPLDELTSDLMDEDFTANALSEPVAELEEPPASSDESEEQE